MKLNSSWLESWSLGLKCPVTMSKTSCFITYFSISWMILCYIYLSTIQTIMKYLFICKWKRMKILKDDLIVRLSVICTFGITFWLTYVNKFWSGGKDKPTVNKFNASLPRFNGILSQYFFWISNYIWNLNVSDYLWRWLF